MGAFGEMMIRNMGGDLEAYRGNKPQKQKFMNVVHITEIYNDESTCGYYINYDLLKPEHKEIIDKEMEIQAIDADMRQVFEIWEDGFQGDTWEYCILDTIKGVEITLLDDLDMYEKQ